MVVHPVAGRIPLLEILMMSDGRWKELSEKKK